MADRLLLAGLGDSRNGEEHWRGVTVERAFANTFERHEAETLIESDCVRFRIGHDANATEPVTLIEGQSKDVPQQHTAYSAALYSSMDTESGKPQYRQRIAGKTASQSCGRKTVTL